MGFPLPGDAMTELVRTGACLCKRITFRVTGEEINVAICHCDNCQRNCGAPYTANAWFRDKVSHILFTRKMHRDHEQSRAKCHSNSNGYPAIAC